MVFVFRSIFRLSVLMGVATALVGVAMLAARDAGGGSVGAQSASAQITALGDNFNERYYWYNDYYSGTDTFPMDVTYSTAGATLEPGESAPCAPIGATIWIEYASDRTGTLSLDTLGSDFDTVIAVYTWDLSGNFLPSPPGDKLIPVACNDETPGAPANLSFAITRNTQYLIQVGGRDGASGNARITARCIDCAPPNDAFGYQQDIYVNSYEPQTTRRTSTANATVQPGEPRPCGNIGATVWYSLYADNPAAISLDTMGSDFDTVVALYRFPLDYYYDGQPDPAALELVACEDDGASPAALVATTDQYRQYWVQVGGASGATGQLQLTARCEPTCPPYNDSIVNAEWWEAPIEGASQRTDGATLEDDEPRPCANIGRTVWYTIVSRGDARIRVNTDDSDFATVLAVYEQSGFSPPPASFDLLSCDAASGDDRASVEFDAESNVMYWIQVGGRNGASGELLLNADCVPAPCPPYNDSIVQPLYFYRPYGEPYENIFDTRGATTEPGEPTDCGDMGATTWWVADVYEPQPDIPFLITTENSTFNTAIAVYEGNLYDGPPTADAFADLRRVGCDDGADGRAQAAFTATPGKRYFLQIGGRNGASGDLRLLIDCQGPCPPDNDNIGGALGVFPLNFSETRDTRGGSHEAGEQQPCDGLSATVWYTFYSGWDATIRVTTEGSDFHSGLAVYAVEGVSPPGGIELLACTRIVDPSVLEVPIRSGITYYVQVGGKGNSVGGNLTISMNCVRDCPADYGLPTDGGGAPRPGGAIGGPDTGSGGYLPGARKR